MALRTGFNDTVGGACAVTVGAVLNPGSRHFLLTAEGRLLEGQLQPGHDILAPAGGTLGASPASSAAAEKFTENIAQVAEISEAAEAPTAVAAGACAEVGVHAGKAVLVVPGLLIRVGEHLVGLTDLLEFFLRFLVAGVPVGMVLHGAFAVGFFNIIGAGILGNPQHLVVIAFIFCHFSFHLTRNTFPRGEGAPKGRMRNGDI